MTLVCIEMKLQSDKMTLCHATLPPPYPPQPPPPGMFFSSRGWGLRWWWKGGMAQFFSSRGWGLRWWWKGWHGTKPFFRSDIFFWSSIWKYFQFDFAGFQDVIWKIFIRGFQNRSYFLAYVIFQFSKFSPNLSTYRWDTLYIYRVTPLILFEFL